MTQKKNKKKNSCEFYQECVIKKKKKFKLGVIKKICNYILIKNQIFFKNNFFFLVNLDFVLKLFLFFRFLKNQKNVFFLFNSF